MSIPGSVSPLLLVSTAGQAPDPPYTGLQISRSVRFNPNDSATFTRAFAAGNQLLWTWSAWVKRAALGEHVLFGTQTSGSDIGYIGFGGDDTLGFNNKVGDTTGYGGGTIAKFRDLSAWYHIVFAFDGAQASYTNRAKIYVNGTLSTLNADSYTPGPGLLNTNLTHALGARYLFGSTSIHFAGYMTDVYFIGGQALTPSSFGQTDTAYVNQWVPKTYSGSYGTNGFHLDFADNSSNTASTLGKDTSGNSNNWTPNNLTVAKTTQYSDPSRFTFNSGTFEWYISGPHDLFDGNLSTGLRGRNANVPGAGYTWNATGLGLSGTLRVHVYADGGNGTTVTVNGATSIFTSSTGYVNFGNVGAINTIQITRFEQGLAHAIEVNGVVLVETLGSEIDSLIDSPTNGTQSDTGVGNEVRGNYCTWNPIDNGGVDLSNGNLDISNGDAHEAVRTTIKLPTTGKWYAECVLLKSTDISAVSNVFAFGIDFSGASTPSNWSSSGHIYIGVNSTTLIINLNGSDVMSINTFIYGAILQVAYDSDTQKLWLGYNNVWRDGSYGTTGNPAAGTNPTSTTVTGGFLVGNFRQTMGSLNTGQRAFAYTAPSGFKALCTQNLSSGTITTIGSYTGNGVADGPFVYLNGVPTAMTVGGNAVTFGTHADKLSNGFKLRTTSTTYNQNALSYSYSISTTGAKFKFARAQPNP